MHKQKFAFVYGVLAMVVVVSWVATAWMVTHPYKLPKDVVKKPDLAAAVKSAAGDQNLVAQCEASITGTVNSNGGTVDKPYKLVSVKTKGDDSDVVVVLTSSVYNGKLDCSFHKSNLQLQQVKPAK